MNIVPWAMENICFRQLVLSSLRAFHHNLNGQDPHLLAWRNLENLEELMLPEDQNLLNYLFHARISLTKTVLTSYRHKSESFVARFGMRCKLKKCNPGQFPTETGAPER